MMMSDLPPTDRPLTAGDWIEHDGGPMPAISGRAEVKLRSGDCFTGSDLTDENTWLHIWGEGDIIAYRLSRPATSAASEGEEDEGDPELPDTPEARTIFKHFCDVHGLRPDEAADSTGSLLADLAALASPPVSERERELEGALREAKDAVDFFDRVKAATQDEQIAVGRDHWNRMEVALRAVAALTAQPAGEPV